MSWLQGGLLKFCCDVTHMVEWGLKINFLSTKGLVYFWYNLNNSESNHLTALM